MLIIPAIDLKDGRCVRLKQGDMSTATVFSEDPVAMAKHWAAEGAKRPHVVDHNVEPIIEPSKVYSGCYGRVSVRACAYDAKGNHGAAATTAETRALRAPR